MHAGTGLAGLLLISMLSAAATPAWGVDTVGLHAALDRLADEGRFSGAVVVRDAEGIRFARGYGFADPFEGRAFTPETPADSASLAKPVTSATVLVLSRDGKVDLDAPVRRYLPEYPHAATTVRHLLSHSAGLELEESEDGLANQDNAALLAAAGEPLFPPGSAFSYCNLCAITLALLIERVTGGHYLDAARQQAALPAGVRLRPQRLSEWTSRAIGHRRGPGGAIERFDSWEGELLYGAANLSISAAQLADWGSRWWQDDLAPIREAATTPARIGDHASGLTLGNWYCAPQGRRCHYLGHHEGFHHMLYWDADRRISVAMLTNNALAPALQQRLQRALVAYAEADAARGTRELGKPLPDAPVPIGRFTLGTGETVEIVANGERRSVIRNGLAYPAYPIGTGIRYVPGLDLYLAGSGDGRLHWLNLYEDQQGDASANAEASGG